MPQRFVIISTGNDTAALDRMEDRFDAHLSPHGGVETFRLGEVDSLINAYWNGARLVNDPSAILLFVHQDALPAFEPGGTAGKDEIEQLRASVPWLLPAVEEPGSWVTTALRLFEKQDTGFLGVAGALSLHPGQAWWNEESVSGAVLHASSSGVNLNGYGPFGRVAVVDGLFLMARASLFDELGPVRNHRGFHFYDMELSLRAHLAGKKNWTIPLLLMHFSGGKTIEDSEWQAAASSFAELHGQHLPLVVEPEPLKGMEGRHAR